MYLSTLLPVFLIVIQLASAASDWSFANWNGYTSTSWSKKWNVVQWSYPHNMNDVAIVSDPVSKQDKVLRILYPKGSYNPSGTKIGGAGFYAKPMDIPADTRTITLTYQVLFPLGFDFKRVNCVLGGKLPGLYGGHSGCSGGNSATTCFSTRLMWRKSGGGEMYAYMPKNEQVKSLCNTKEVVCNQEYGYSLGRDSFSWKTGKWNTITQTINLNTVGKQDGSATVQYNGQTVFSVESLVYRMSQYTVAGIDFETFFGGSTAQWATPKSQYAYFKGFKLSYQ
ncbi:hypothetical protein INT43_006126 [Umbelopsis isabellina]|uniref:Polysaccharide lyase 14 domain-containing protein n=1 Tax=Mortierella isabellina TaxID=91625 RepID=A0A8H7PZR2_MORIS|nr:hypothetical protein INT43_006126 [Umbelopsis isabellina]